jgi:hypothetical protein
MFPGIPKRLPNFPLFFLQRCLLKKTINKSLEKNKVRETILTICFDHSSDGYFKSDKIKSAEIL